MTSNTLQVKNGEPHFVIHEAASPLPDNCVRLEMINVLLSSTELNILNKTKNVDDGLILGGVGVGRVLEVHPSIEHYTQGKNIVVGSVVAVSSKSPCQRCPACEKERWEECKDPQTLGAHTNGVAASEAWVHAHTLTKVDIEPDVESVRQYLMHEIVSKGIWLSTQDLITRDSSVGIVGRPFLAQILKHVIEDLTVVEISTIQQGFASAGPGRFDLVSDCVGESRPPEEVGKLVRPGGTLIHSYMPARLAALERSMTSPLLQMDFLAGPSFLAVEWIAQNPQYFNAMGAAFAFSPSGLSSLLKNEGLRETYGFLYFELRPKWTELSNLDQGVVFANPISEVA